MSANAVLAKLCTLLVREMHGELPARLVDILLTRGRSTVSSLAKDTAVPLRYVRHGLVVLLQHDLVYYLVRERETHYEANVTATYNLIRGGKLLDMAGISLGPAAKDVMQNLLALGQTRISDITAAYTAKLAEAVKVKLQAAAQNGDMDFGEDAKATAKRFDAQPIKSVEHLNSTICRLVEADLVEVVHPKTHMSHGDIYTKVKAETEKKYFPTGIRGEKQKTELLQRVAEALHKLQGESKALRRKLEHKGSFVEKKRRLQDGSASVGESSEVINMGHDEDTDPALDQRQVIRANYEKCVVNLRNRYFVECAIEWIGETTGHVYSVLLKLFTKNMHRCRTNWPLEVRALVEDIDSHPASVTTEEILDNLKPSVVLTDGIGKAPDHLRNRKWAERVRKRPREYRLAYMTSNSDDDGDGSSGEEDHGCNGGGIDGADDNAADDWDLGIHAETQPPLNAKSTKSRVKFNGMAAKNGQFDRRSQLRDHLLLLAHSPKGFARHCGRDEWTVDFDNLVKHLQDEEMYAAVENGMGRLSRRLVAILHAKGKVSDKILPKHALMTLQETRTRLNELFAAGVVETQEVPIDNKADIQKSHLFWHYDRERAMETFLYKVHKIMLHYLQKLEVLRRDDHDVLETAKRTDVRGREKERMLETYYGRYNRFLRDERMLLGQLMRLDDLAATLRDY